MSKSLNILFFFFTDFKDWIYLYLFRKKLDINNRNCYKLMLIKINILKNVMIIFWEVVIYYNFFVFTFAADVGKHIFKFSLWSDGFCCLPLRLPSAFYVLWVLISAPMTSVDYPPNIIAFALLLNSIYCPSKIDPYSL